MTSPLSYVIIGVLLLQLSACSISPNSPPSEQNTEEDKPEVECTYEWVTGIAEITGFYNDKAELVFYPGEERFTVDPEGVSDFYGTGSDEQVEIKAKIKKPLNQHCGKTEILFYE